ncbi:pickpocket protein 28-like [Chironomus tepperi]|uniref:pickpocket protein 28-like n=1 Tax=Chironomus tepperi TaxID=113505 RepID=UPI00391F86BB
MVSNAKLSPIESSIHGIRYIADSNSHKSVRIFWLIIFLLSIIGFSFYVYGVYSKWMLAPDIGITANLKPIREIPFPAVTICSPMNIKNEFANFNKVYNELNINGTINAEELINDKQKMISAIVQSCDPNLSTFFTKIIKQSASQDLIDHLIRGSFKSEEAFFRCYLNSNFKKNCSEMFNRIVTDDGICYSYNMQGYNTLFNKNSVDSDFDLFYRKGIKNIAKDHSVFFDEDNEEVEWTLQQGYNSNDDTVFPFRIISKNSIEFIMMHPKTETNNYCPALRNSYKIIFHMPNEIPTKFHDYIYSSMGSQFLISMTAKHFMTDSSLKKHPPEIRGCYFENERKLKFFKSYTRAHCDLECLTNHTLKICGCVRFSMPRSSKTSVCDLDETACYNDAMRHWPHDVENSLNFAVPCNCYPPCNNIKYSTKLIDHVNIDSLSNAASFHTLRNHSNSDEIITSIKIIFEEFLIDEQTNFVAYKLENFIAECGGLLGLFMGCSMLSIVELFYLCFKKITDKKNRYSNTKHLKNQNFSRHNRVFCSQSMRVRNLQKRNYNFKRQTKIKKVIPFREVTE